MSNPNYPNNPNQNPQYQTPQSFAPPFAPTGPRMNGLAITAMILGILAILTAIIIVGAVVGIVALILGIIAIAQINKYPQRFSGTGLAWTGVITGILSLVLTVVVGFAIMVPSLGRAREISNRAYCAANLTGILKSANVYANDNMDDFPTVLPPTTTNVAFAGGTASAPTPDGAITELYSSRSTQRGNISANLWLLVLKGYAGPKQFICKSDPNFSMVAAPSTGGLYNNNFPGVQNITYAAAIPWTRDGRKAGFWKAIVDASLPLMADPPPHNGDSVSGGTVSVNTRFPSNPKMWNSPVHAGDGQVVGWSDAHAGFERRPDIGYADDNIWTQNGGSPSPTGSAPTYGSGTSSGAYSRSISDYPNAGGAGNWDIYMAPARGTDGRVY